MARSLLAAGLLLLVANSSARVVTLRNDVPRNDTTGQIVDAHSGNIVKVNSTYFLYGEHYGTSSGFGETMWPKLVVYTSPDMVSWDFRGFLHNNTNPGWSWPTAPEGTFFTPNAVWNSKTQRMVIWFNAYMNGCCDGGFGIAESADGIHFNLITLTEEAKYPQVDSNTIFVDDDGTGYIAYTSINPGPGLSDHRVAIELLAPDFLSTTKQQVGPLFPDDYVEGPSLFKRNGIYYMTYGSCCCFCREGSGVVVYSARSITGPWTRQESDVNCKVNATICAGYPDPDPITPDSCTACPRTFGQLQIAAQGIGLSVIPLADGTQAYLWMGERWLSAPGNPPQCENECQPMTGQCQPAPNYVKGHGFMYWIPLEFGRDGTIQKFAPFVNSFTLDV